MKKLILVLVAVFVMASVAFAQEEGISITDQLKKLPALKQGVAYSFLEHGVSYLTTMQVASWKVLGFEVGYSSTDKAVAVVSCDLLKLKDLGVNLPVLDLIDFKVGLYGGVGRIALGPGNAKENNEWDFGASLTLISLNF